MSTTLRLVVCVRWRPPVAEAETETEVPAGQAWGELARPLAERATALGGRIVGWQPGGMSVDFAVDGLQDAVDFLLDEPLSPELSCGIAHGELSMLTGSSRMALCTGEVLDVVVKLADYARPGEVLLTPELVAATSGELCTKGAPKSRAGREAVPALILDLVSPLRSLISSPAGAEPSQAREGEGEVAAPSWAPVTNPSPHAGESAHRASERAPFAEASERDALAGPSSTFAGASAEPESAEPESVEPESVEPLEAEAEEEGEVEILEVEPEPESLEPLELEPGPESDAVLTSPSAAVFRVASVAPSSDAPVSSSPMSASPNTPHPPASLRSDQVERFRQAASAVRTDSLFPASVDDALGRRDASSLDRLAASYRERHQDQLAFRLDAIASLVRGQSAEALRELRSAQQRSLEASLSEQCRARLALAVGLNAAGRPREAFVEALGALARAREGRDQRGERACARMLAQLSSGFQEPEAAAQWESLSSGAG